MSEEKEEGEGPREDPVRMQRRPKESRPMRGQASGHLHLDLQLPRIKEKKLVV